MKVMTYGFTNAPLCFQQYMDKVFTLLLYKGVEIYLDNILMHHKTEAKHIKGVLSVLKCLEDVGLLQSEEMQVPQENNGVSGCQC